MTRWPGGPGEQRNPSSSLGGKTCDSIYGGLTVQAPATWLSIWNLEILVSENLSRSRTFGEPGSSPKSYDRPWGGLNIHSGKGCQYVNLVIHDNAQGISFWSGASDSEVHGCILYDNGWKAPTAATAMRSTPKTRTASRRSKAA